MAERAEQKVLGGQGEWIVDSADAITVLPADVPGENEPEGQNEHGNIPKEMPVLPIRGTVMFPGTIMPLGVGRPSSARLLEESLPVSKVIALVTQHDEEEEDPKSNGLYSVGTAVSVLKLTRQPDGTISIIVHGLRRIRVTEYVQEKPFFKARVRRIRERPGSGKRFEAGVSQLRDQARQLIELTPNAPEQALTVLMNIDEPGNLADFLVANLNLDIQQKQDMLEEVDVAKRVRAVHQHVSNQLEIAELQQKIQHDVQSAIGEGQRKFFLREQIKAIQKELGEENDASGGVLQELRERLEAAGLPEKVMKEANRDLSRLDMIPPASPEYAVVFNYLELIADLPWNVSSQESLDLAQARKILDRDHYGLEKVKRRLIEFLAVRKLNPEGRGPILCLVGPPGVGKTSLGESIAEALGRKFARLSLGGIRDEAEIRGHRRTYVGAMPGRILQGLLQRGHQRIPVFMLDEIDKIGSDHPRRPVQRRCSRSSIPSQNHSFRRPLPRRLGYDLSRGHLHHHRQPPSTPSSPPFSIAWRCMRAVRAIPDEEKMTRSRKRHLDPTSRWTPTDSTDAACTLQPTVGHRQGDPRATPARPDCASLEREIGIAVPQAVAAEIAGGGERTARAGWKVRLDAFAG